MRLTRIPLLRWRHIDVVTSTQVLLYVPGRDAGCMSQIRASLKPGGVFMATVYLGYILTGNPDNSADKYNQLKSHRTWERGINSSIMRFNRFRARDYREMLEEAGFEVVHFEVEPAQDYAELDASGRSVFRADPEELRPQLVLCGPKAMILVLTYHKVLRGPDPESGFYTIQAGQLERQLELLAQSGLQALAPEKLVGFEPRPNGPIFLASTMGRRTITKLCCRCWRVMDAARFSSCPLPSWIAPAT